MKLPFRKTKPQPIITQPETVKTVESVEVQPDPDDQPFTAVEPARQVQPELMQMCACCGTVGATNPIKVSYFGYVDLPFVKICDACEEARKAAKERHYVPLRKTLLETPAIPKTRKKAMNGGVVNIGLAGKDSGPEMVIPLEERAVNLALEA